MFGITLGKERGTGHNVWSADAENVNRDGNIHYIEVLFRVLRNGWNKENAIESGGVAGQPYWLISLPSINYSGPSSSHPGSERGAHWRQLCFRGRAR